MFLHILDYYLIIARVVLCLVGILKMVYHNVNCQPPTSLKSPVEQLPVMNWGPLHLTCSKKYKFSLSFSQECHFIILNSMPLVSFHMRISKEDLQLTLVCQYSRNISFPKQNILLFNPKIAQPLQYERNCYDHLKYSFEY